MHDGREVANFVLDYADKNGLSLTNLGLQKIIYFCHVWFLVAAKKPLIKQNFEAWEYGPVLPYLHRSFKEFGDEKITARATKLDPHTGNEVIAIINMDKVEKSLLEDIVSIYSRLSVNQLVEQSHVPGGPWYKVWHHDSRVNPGMQINNQEILNYYTAEERPYTLQ
ncbi:MAG: type II toxin-antitoxin system antitoxin SocA domain-containing protein [Candidatus Thiodiazotropha sp.]